MRALVALWFLILTALAFGDTSAVNSLILIQPAAAGIGGGIDSYGYPQWVLWPPHPLSLSNGSQSALLSLLTGHDWAIDPVHAQGFAALDAQFEAKNGADFSERGVFAAQRKVLGSISTYVLERSPRASPESVLLLGMHDRSGRSRIVPWNSVWPSNGLLIYEARSWDEVASVAGRTGGRTLVVEYPPRVNQPWTRFWTYRKGWPPGVLPVGRLHVPGLIDAHDVAKLLLDPNSFKWVKDRSWQSGAANRWLEMGHRWGPLLLIGLGICGAIASLATVAAVFRERRSPIVAEIVRVLMLSPAALVLAGWLGEREGIGFLPFLIPVCTLALWLFSLIGSQILRVLLVDAHPLLATACVGFLTMTAMSPLWSPFSNSFGWIRHQAPGDALGCWFAYGVGAIACLRGASVGLEWLFRFGSVGLLALPILRIAWWAPDPFPYGILPLLLIAFGEGFWRWYLSPLVVLVGFVSDSRWLNGVAWNPGGLIKSLPDSDRIDLSGYVSAIVSPLAILTLFLVGGGCLFGNRFFLHQMRKLAFVDPRRTAVLTSSGGLALIGVSQPIFLTAALWCGIGGMLVLLYDGAMTL